MIVGALILGYPKSAVRTLSVYEPDGRTSSGVMYTRGSIHCASNSWPNWSIIKVTSGGKYLILPVLDKMGPLGDKRVDMSIAAYRYFSKGELGLIPNAEVELISLGDGRYRHNGKAPASRAGTRAGRTKAKKAGGSKAPR